MTDLRDDFKRMIDVMGKASSHAHLKDLIAYADEAVQHRCGNCTHWMKSRSCPREHNVRGISRGPSMSAAPCNHWTADSGYEPLIQRRRSEANAFADKHGFALPFPQQEPQS